MEERSRPCKTLYAQKQGQPTGAQEALGAPEYNWTIPGALKNALDWRIAAPQPAIQGQASRDAVGHRRPLGGAGMQYHLRMALTFLCASVFGTPEVRPCLN